MQLTEQGFHAEWTSPCSRKVGNEASDKEGTEYNEIIAIG